jgi:hypothetical protein
MPKIPLEPLSSSSAPRISNSTLPFPTADIALGLEGIDASLFSRLPWQKMITLVDYGYYNSADTLSRE